MTYPATLQIDTPDRLANWRPLVQWILGIPHLIVTSVLKTVAQVLSVIAWVMIVFTGRMSSGLADFMMMTLRYEARWAAYSNGLHATYPPFEFPMTADDPGNTPTRASFSPAMENRNRLSVLLRLIYIIPAAIFFYVIQIIGAISLLLGVIAVLFTGRWPAGLRRMVVGSQLVNLRASAYGLLLTDQYPPFSLD